MSLDFVLQNFNKLFFRILDIQYPKSSKNYSFQIPAAFSSKTEEKTFSASELDKVSSFIVELKDFLEVLIFLQTNNAADVITPRTRCLF